MFEPGHLHRTSLPGDSPAWHLDLHYDVQQDARRTHALPAHFRGT